MRRASGGQGLLGVVLLAGLLAAWGLEPMTVGRAEAAPVKVQMAQALDSLDFLALYLARHFNYFAEEGIDLEVVVMSGGGGPNIQAVISGNAQFTPTGVLTMLPAVRQDQPLLIVGALFNALAANVALRTEVAKAKSITAQSPLEQKYKALRGLTLGVTRPGALTDHVMRYIVARAGLVAGKDVQLVGVGTGQAALAALEQAKVDGVVHLSPVPEQAVHNGTGVMLFNNSAGEIPELRDFLGLGLVTTKDYASKNPEVVRKVNRALARAGRWVLDHKPAETAAILQRYIPGVQPEVLTAVVQANLRGVSPDVKIRPECITGPQKLEVEMGLAKAVLEWSTFATNAYTQ